MVEKWKSVLLGEKNERCKLVWQLPPLIIHYFVRFFVTFTMMYRILLFSLEFALNCVCIYRPTSKDKKCVFGKVGLVSKTKWMLEKYYEKLISQISDTVTLLCVDNFTISFSSAWMFHIISSPIAPQFCMEFCPYGIDVCFALSTDFDMK